MGDTNYEEVHRLSSKDRSHQANTWWQVDVQGATCTKASPRTRQKYWRFCLAVLCQLYSFQPGHATVCIPHSVLRFHHPPDFQWRPLDVVMGHPSRISPDWGGAWFPGQISFCWPWCHKMEIQCHAFWAGEWAGNINCLHSWCWQFMDGACLLLRRCYWQGYKHKYNCWRHT